MSSGEACALHVALLSPDRRATAVEGREARRMLLPPVWTLLVEFRPVPPSINQFS